MRVTKIAGFVAAAMLGFSMDARSAPSGATAFGAFGIDLTARNTDVRPGDDFWTFANGG